MPAVRQRMPALNGRAAPVNRATSSVNRFSATVNLFSARVNRWSAAANKFAGDTSPKSKRAPPSCSLHRTCTLKLAAFCAGEVGPLHRSARAEFLHEVEYFSRLSVRLGERYDRAVLAAEARAAETPELGPSYKHKTRRIIDRKFKFSLVYLYSETQVVVVAIPPQAGLLEGAPQ
jgi:plasmid stabilization system protein ParE